MVGLKCIFVDHVCVHKYYSLGYFKWFGSAGNEYGESAAGAKSELGSSRTGTTDHYPPRPAVSGL